MRLLTPQEMPPAPPGTVCRQSRMAVLLSTAIMAAMLIGIPGFLAWHAPLPTWIKVLAAGLAGLIVKWLWGNVSRSWHSSNWLMRFTRDGLWINIRSYQNHDLPPGQTVVHVPYDEIHEVCEHAWKRAEKNGGRTTIWTDKFLEIRLKVPVPDELRAELAEELRRYVSRSHLGGLVKSRSRNGHATVTISRDGTLRLAWRGRLDCVTPPLRRVLRELKARVRVGPASHSELSYETELSSQEVDSLTLQLAESGDKLGAVKLLKDRRGYSTTEARQFVDELIDVR